MSWIHDTLAEYGRGLGIEGLDFGGHGVAQLQMQSGGLVAVEPVRRDDVDEVLVYVARPAGHDAGRLMAAGLARAHHSQGAGLPVQMAARGSGPDTLVIALVRLPERAFTPQALAHAVDHLQRWLDDAQAG